MTVKMYGYSDDLVEVEGVSSARDITDHEQDGDDYPEASGNRAEYNIYKPASFVINNQIRVEAQYTPIGTWVFAPGLVEDGAEWPNWPVRLSAFPDNDYAMQLEIDIPDDEEARIVRVR